MWYAVSLCLIAIGICFIDFKKNLNPIFPRLMDFQIFFLEGVSLPKTQRIFSFLMYYICERETYTLPEAGPDYANKGVILRKSQILMCFCNAI